MHPDVVRMRVALLVVGVGDDHLRSFAPDDLDECADGLVERDVGERRRILVGIGVGHARVAVVEHHDLVVPDDLAGQGQLVTTHFREPLAHLGCVHGRVEDVALLAARTGHERGVDAFGLVLRDRARTLGRLVVGMGVHAQQRELIGDHPVQAIGTSRRHRAG